jgi:serine/threonine protein kinase
MSVASDENELSGDYSAEDATRLPPMSGEALLKGMAIAAGEEAGAAPVGEMVSFRILGTVGQGGMGLVYRAEQVYPKRVVALKVLKRSVADRHARRRFGREVEIMGRLNHRGVAQLYFAGFLEDGQPFMAMEYIHGMPLASYAQAHRLSTEARLGLFLKVCDAVAYAHGQGVIHRDLKPSNILVTADGEPKVLDFGLATGTQQRDETQLTLHGQVVGTLDYMSPEQAEGRGEIDGTSDVYAMGILLYELLATRRPYDLSSVSLMDAVRVIKETAPARLSISNRAYRGDLETIVHKALSKEKAGRYASVEAMAADLRRWLGHEPILARPPSALYRASRFARRHRVLVTSVSLIIASLSAGLVVAAWEAVRANREAINAHVEAERARSAAAYSDAVNAKLSEELSRNEVQNARLEMLAGDDSARSADAIAARVHYDAAWEGLAKHHESTMEVEWRVWAVDQTYARPIEMLDPEGHDAQATAISQNQRHAALGHGSGFFEVRSLMAYEPEVSHTFPDPVVHLGFSPNDELAFAQAGKEIEVWSIGQRQCIATISTTDNVSMVTLADDRIYYRDSARQLHEHMLGGGDRELPEFAVCRTLSTSGNNLLVRRGTAGLSGTIFGRERTRNWARFRIGSILQLSRLEATERMWR